MNVWQKGFLLAGVLGLTLSSLYAQPGHAETAEKETWRAHLSKVDQVGSVPEAWKSGYESITDLQAQALLGFLASDLLEGRETAQRGMGVATEYAASLLASWGLKPAGDPQQVRYRSMFDAMAARRHQKPEEKTFFQAVPLRETLGTRSALNFEQLDASGARTRTHLEDGLDYVLSASGGLDLDAPLVFVGYGIAAQDVGFDEYRGVDVRGRVVLMMEGSPGPGGDKGRLEKIQKAVAPAEGMMRRMLPPQFKMAKKAGALAVISVNPDGKAWAARLAPRPKPSDSKPIIEGEEHHLALAVEEGMDMPWMTLPRIALPVAQVDDLLKPYGKTLSGLKKQLDASLKPVSFPMNRTRVQVTRTIEEKATSCRNVLAYLEGSDPKLKDEVVILGAHLDHLGQRGAYVFNGADDNGSGAVAVLQCAHAFATHKQRPRRSVLFALWTGEEKGLLGSRFYVSHPSMPLDKTRLYINMDMVSRTWDAEGLKRMGRMIGVSGSAEELAKEVEMNRFATFSLLDHPGLEDILKKSNESVGLHMLLRPTKDSMGGSDHWPFGNAGVPWIFLMSAMTEDYHQPSDEVDRCSFSLMTSLTRMAYLTAVQMAE